MSQDSLVPENPSRLISCVTIAQKHKAVCMAHSPAIQVGLGEACIEYWPSPTSTFPNLRKHYSLRVQREGNLG